MRLEEVDFAFVVLDVSCLTSMIEHGEHGFGHLTRHIKPSG
jgi:hypothetical protein